MILSKSRIYQCLDYRRTRSVTTIVTGTTTKRSPFSVSCSPWGSEALNIKAGGTEATRYVVIRKIPVFFQSCFHCLAWCILLQYYTTFQMFQALCFTAFFSPIFSLYPEAMYLEFLFCHLLYFFFLIVYMCVYIYMLIYMNKSYSKTDILAYGFSLLRQMYFLVHLMIIKLQKQIKSERQVTQSSTTKTATVLT